MQLIGKIYINAGEYKIAPDLKNGRQYYVSKNANEAKAIWFDKREAWVVGPSNFKNNLIGIFSSNGEISIGPGEVLKYSWEYLNKINDEWMKGGDNIQVECNIPD